MTLLALALLALGWDDPPRVDHDESGRLDMPPSLRAEEPPLYTFRLSPTVRWITGHATVRENQVEGTKVDVDRDLGLRMAVGGNAQFERDASDLQFLGEVEELFGYGGRSVDRPFAWNGTVYSAPSRVRTHSSLLTVRGELAFKLLSGDDGRSWLGPVLGVEWPYYTVSVGTNLQHGSLEDWVHYLPYPILGLAGRVGLSETIDLQARLIGGYLPNVPTPFTEGGRLHVAVHPGLCLEVPITWSVSSTWQLSCTLTYQYWAGTDRSTEDGNRLVLSSPGLMLGIAYRW